MHIKFPICYERSKSGESAVLVGADAELVGELWSITDEELEELVSMANKGAEVSAEVTPGEPENVPPAEAEAPKPHPYAGKKMGHPDGDMSYRCGSEYCRCAQ